MLQNTQLIARSYILFLTLFLSFSSYAAQENYSRVLSGSEIYVGNTLDLEDGKFPIMMNDPTWMVNRFKLGKVMNIISLNFDMVEIQKIPACTLTVGYSLILTDDDGIPSTETGTLTIEYDPSNSSTFMSQDIKVHTGGHMANLTITSISSSGINIVPDAFELKNKMVVERYYLFDVNEKPEVEASITNQEILLAWPKVEGAHHYEISWSFIDNYDGTGGTVAPSNLDFNLRFDANVTRTNANFIRLPMTYNQGYVVYVVRAVGKFVEENSPYKYMPSEIPLVFGEWSGQLKTDIDKALPDGAIAITNSMFDQDINWVSTNSYRHKGDFSTSMEYMDGTMRSRQRLSKNREVDQALLTETYYDHYGRPAVQSLVAPTASPSMEYYDNFNRDPFGTVPYSKENFDKDDPQNDCYIDMEGMNHGYGASKYYSYTNTNDDGAQAFVPQAEKYPFTQIEYSGDPTGAISRATLPGDQHRLESGNNREIQYSDADQELLNHLFGTDAGYDEGYKRQTTVDENGQMTARYLNSNGQIIATSVIGEAPPNLLNLDNETNGGSAIDVTSSMLPNGDHIWNLIHDHFVPSASYYDFEYKITPESFGKECTQNYCYDCHYDLNINIVDECGVEMFDQDYDIGPATIDDECASPILEYTALVDDLYLEKGFYEIRRTLSVDLTDIEEYTELFLSTDCVDGYEDFLDVEIGEGFDLNCGVTPCEAHCIDQLGTEEDYIAGGGTHEQYMVLFNQCMIDCGKPDPCADLLEILKADVRPGGQYALFNDNGSVNPSAFPLSVLNSSNLLGTNENWKYPTTPYLDADGNVSKISINNTLYDPEDVNIEVFIEHYILNPSWANSLVEYHPEYCLYDACEQQNVTGSHDWDFYFNLETKYVDANSQGFFNPLSASTIDGVPSAIGNSTQDPFFFHASSPGLSYYNDAKDKMRDFVTVGSSTYTIWEMAIVYTYCPSATTETQINNCLTNSPDYTSPGCSEDMVWMMFQRFYQEVKQEIMREVIAAYTIENYCYNGCIGSRYFDYDHNEYDFKSGPYYNTSQPCHSSTEAYYAEKEPRYPLFMEETTLTIEDECEDECTEKMLYWSEALESCTLGSAESSVLAELFELCTLGCDIANPGGASTLPSGSMTGNGNTSVDEVLEYHLGSSYMSELCSPWLISDPMPYGHTEGVKQSKVDECACDRILQNEHDFQNLSSSIPLVSDGQDYFAHQYGVSLPFYDQYVCDCEDIYLQEHATSWSPSATWNAASITALEVLDRETFINIGCNTCLDCDMISDAIDDVTTLHSFSSNYTYFDHILKNYINSQYLTDHTLSQINEVRYRCELASNSGGTHCTSEYEEVEELEYVFNELITNGDLLNQVGSASNLIAIEDYWGGYLYDHTVGHYFWAENSTTSTSTTGDFNVGILFNNEVISECQIQLDIQGSSLPSYVELGNLTEVSNMSALTSSTNGMNYGFTMDADFDDPFSSSTYNGTIEGYSTCYPVKTCYIESELSLCTPEIQRFEENDIDNCVLDQYTNAEQNAWNDFQDYLQSQAFTFQIDYETQCSLAIESESWDKMYKIYDYHFTLFYYDQVGNLIKTVPPNGIDHLTIKLDDQVAQQAVNDARGAGTTYVPSHSMETHYRYNSRNQLVLTASPNGGAEEYWYDDAGKLIYTQNTLQASQSPQEYNYIWRDEFDRTIQSGVVATSYDPDSYDANRCDVETFIASGTRSEVTVITYDKLHPYTHPFPVTLPALVPRNRTNRVACIEYKTNYASDYDNAYFYSYDEQGNVEFVVFHNRELDSYKNGTSYSGVKYTHYDYDHSSGNLVGVAYQGLLYDGEEKRNPDAFYTQFFYDENNRLHSIETSTDQLEWREEATYFYYDHGPLARVELGHDKVHGEDHFYTIHQWVKGVNSNALDPARDPGNDGTLGYFDDEFKIHKTIAEDAYGFSLAYYDDDYSEIEPLSTANHPIADIASSSFAGGSFKLFNGAMRHKVTSIQGLDVQGNAYKYDQLYRLKQLSTFKDLNMTANTWPVGSSFNEFGTTYIYDPNGNILDLTRNGNTTYGLDMDDLEFYLISGTDRVDYVTDAGTNYAAYDDIKSGQTSGNYLYNSIGQMTKDIQENITDITYTSSGKVKQMSFNTGYIYNINFDYDAFGNRVRKMVELPSTGYKTFTYYMHGASGDLQAMYEAEYEPSVDVQGDYTFAMGLRHVPLVGYGRLGLYERNKPIISQTKVSGVKNTTNYEDDWNLSSFISGQKQYELTDHLGNVQTTVSDVKKFNNVSQLYEELFDGASTSGWSADPSGSWVTLDNPNDRLVVTPPSLTNGAVRTFTTVIGQTYWLDIDLDIGTIGEVGFKAYPNGGSLDLGSSYSDASGNVGFYFTATSTSTDVKLFWKDGSAGTFYINALEMNQTSFVADVITKTDYYPFGMAMPGRTTNSQFYKYGLNGVEKDDEVKGYNNSYGTYFRHYDPRLARWTTTDPVVQPWQSPYVAFDNNPIYYADPMGDVSICIPSWLNNAMYTIGQNIGPIALSGLGTMVAEQGVKAQDITSNSRGQSDGAKRVTLRDRNTGHFTDQVRDPQIIGLPEGEKLVVDFTTSPNRRLDEGEYVSRNIKFRDKVPDLDGDPTNFDGVHDPTANVVPWKGPKFGVYMSGDDFYNPNKSLSLRLTVLNPTWSHDYNGDARKAFEFISSDGQLDFEGLLNYMSRFPDKVFVRWPIYPSDVSGSKGWYYGMINNKIR